MYIIIYVYVKPIERGPSLPYKERKKQPKSTDLEKQKASKSGNGEKSTVNSRKAKAGLSCHD